MSISWRLWLTAPRLAPLVGVLIGCASALVYWAAVQIWPTSIGVVLAMFAATVLSNRSRLGGLYTVGFLFGTLIKYNALMALSAASLPFAAPPNVALGLIMIAALASSRGLSLWANPTAGQDLAIAVVLGFAPALLLGVPGLIGLASAIVALIAFIAISQRSGKKSDPTRIDAIRQMTEICFYLGSLAASAYI